MLTDKLGNISPIDGAVSTDPMLARISELNQSSTPYIMLVAFRFQTPTGSTLLQNGLQELFAGAKTPSEVAQDIAQGLASAG